MLTPWDKRIKTVESESFSDRIFKLLAISQFVHPHLSGYFGSSVASYFTFLRWLVYINVIMAAVSVAFVVVPEVSDLKMLLPVQSDTNFYLS